ncbi:hypothetical protein HanOQP8_Chr10g0381491 [Helianthus annuus]|nr:hypothetical protein HanOQP8_Chr10g0381491 [Helianthus annuus]
MEFNFLGIDKQKQYNYMLPTLSSSNYTYISDQPMIHGGRSVVPVGFPSSLMVGQPLRSYRQFEPEMWLHGERFLPYDATVSMPLEERYYGGEGYDHRREITGFEAAQFQRLRQSPTMLVSFIPLYFETLYGKYVMNISYCYNLKPYIIWT